MSLKRNFVDDFCRASNGILKSLYNSEDKRIFHYTSQEVLLQILQNKTLRFSDHFYLNDETEGIYTLNLMIDNIDTIIPDDSKLAQKKKEIREICQKNLDGIRGERFSLYQCSFSLNDDCLPLWNYYSKNNEMHGVNIGFDSKELVGSIENNILRANGIDNNQLFVMGGTVIYDVSEQIKIIRKIIDQYENLFYKHFKNSDIFAYKTVFYFSQLLSRIILVGTFFKAECFSHEKEYRLAVNLKNNDGELVALKDKCVQYVSRNDFYLPYIDLSFGLACIKSVAISPTYDFEKMKNNMQVMLKNFGVDDDVKIVQSQIPVRY